VRERFAGLAGTIEVEPRTLTWELDSEEELLRTLTSTGTHEVFAEAVGPEAHAAWQADFLELARESNQGSEGAVVLEAEYIVAVARKRG
jgi:hypothetical protein